MTREISEIQKDIRAAIDEGSEAYKKWKSTGDKKYHDQEDAAEKRRMALEIELEEARAAKFGITKERMAELEAMPHCAVVKVMPEPIVWGGVLTLREIGRESRSRTKSMIFLKVDGLNVKTDQIEQMFLYFTNEQAKQIIAGLQTEVRL